MEVALYGPWGRTVLGPTIVTIGRAQDNQLVISDQKASTHHAEIRPAGQGHLIIDLGSLNGTFVNHQLLNRETPRMLYQGDAIRIGDTTFTYVVNVAQPGGRIISDGSTQRADSGSTPPPGFHTGYGYGVQQEYQAQALRLPPPSQALYTPPVSATNLPPVQPMSSGSFGPSQSLAQQPSFTLPPPAYMPPQPQQQKVPPVRAIALAVIALIIILAAVGSFFIYHNNQVAQDNSNATATAQTSHNNAATAQAQRNATAFVNLTATAIVTSHYPPFTNLGLHDPLTSTSSDWQSGSICQFTSGGYQVSIAQANTFQYCLNSGRFGDFAYQVTASIQQGDCGGLIFRHIDNSNFFFFEVCQNGTYNFRAFINKQEKDLYSSFHSSSAIQQGLNKQNIMAITLQGDTVNMYVNGQNIDGATDQALTSSVFSQGGIGLMADDTPDPTAVTYTNALVWTAS